MLTDRQRSELATTGVTRLPGVVGPAVTAGMADAVWSALATRGIERADPTTWPKGYVTKHQALRRARVFDPFDTEATAAVVDELLGPGSWCRGERWGPALVTFPEPGPWTVPHARWHLDLPGRGAPDRPAVARLFGYVTDVVPGGGATVVVEGSHELVRRLVAAAPGHDAGSSADLRRKLTTLHPWFGALCREGGDRVRRFMVDGEEIDGVHVRVSELTADAGDVVVMLPWTLHGPAMNGAPTPRFMVTYSARRAGGRGQPALGDSPFTASQ